MMEEDISKINIARITEGDHRVQILEDHLKSASKLCKLRAEKIGLGPIGELSGLIHDFGKATDLYSRYIRSATGLINSEESEFIDFKAKKGKIDHSTAGAQYLHKLIAENIAYSRDPAINAIVQMISHLVISHHSGLINILNRDGKNSYETRIYKDENNTRLGESLKNIDDQIKDQCAILLNGEEMQQTTGNYFTLLKTLGDKEAISFTCSLTQLMLLSCLVDADRTDSSNFANNNSNLTSNIPDWSQICQMIDSHIESKNDKSEIGKLRNAVYLRCRDRGSGEKGIYTLTVPTGGGKTFSSLRFAVEHVKKHSMDRIFYVVPYTSIIDQNANVIRKVIDPIGNIVLEHHSNIGDEMRENNWFTTCTENWDAPVIFTTMVQFLESVFGSGCSGVRRIHNLANSVIIFDEVQAVPIKCVYSFNLLINYLHNICGSTIILCTATQPLLQHKGLKHRINLSDDHEIVENVTTLYDQLQRVEFHNHLKLGGSSSQEIADFTLKQVEEHGNALVITNTKPIARKICELIQGKTTAKVIHLSTNMCPAHRKEVIKDLKKDLEDGTEIICVSTQLIEAGIDIDFNVVIRLLAGVDSIAQAAGRCNRHGKKLGLGHVFLFDCHEEKVGSLTDIKIGGETTRRLLNENLNNLAKITEPQILEDYYNYYFYNRKNEMSYLIPNSESFLELMSSNNQAICENQNSEKVQYGAFLKQSFSDAAQSFHVIDKKSNGVIVPYGEGKNIARHLSEARSPSERKYHLRKCQQYTVNLYESQIKILLSRGGMNEIVQDSGIYLLERSFYDDFYGLKIDSEVDTLFY